MAPRFQIGDIVAVKPENKKAWMGGTGFVKEYRKYAKAVLIEWFDKRLLPTWVAGEKLNNLSR